MALLETFTDNFEDNIVGADWGSNIGTTSESGGQAHVGCTTGGDSGYFADGPWDLTGSYAAIKVAKVPAYGTGTRKARFQLRSDDDNSLWFLIDGRDLVFVARNAGVETYDYTRYSATLHKWWRFREALGTVYFETSADGLVWHEQYTYATPAWVTSMGVRLLSWYTGTETVDEFVIDQFNVFTGNASSKRVMADFVVDCALADGAICTYVDHTAIACYQGSYAAIGLARAHVDVDPAAGYLDVAQGWLDWYVAHMDPTTHYVVDYGVTSEATGTAGAYDSTDATAAMFIFAVYACKQAGLDVSSYTTAVRNALTAVYSTLESDGLTTATPAYNVALLEDNAEVYVGLVAAANLLGLADVDGVLANTRAQELAVGLDTLYSGTASPPGYGLGKHYDAGGGIDAPSWTYNTAASQCHIWPVVFEVGTEANRNTVEALWPTLLPAWATDSVANEWLYTLATWTFGATSAQVVYDVTNTDGFQYPFVAMNAGQLLVAFIGSVSAQVLPHPPSPIIAPGPAYLAVQETSVYRVLLGNTLSGKVHTELPLSSFSFSHILNAPGSFRGTIGLNHPKATPENLDPLRTTIFVERGGLIVWAGLLWTVDADQSNNTISIGGEGFWSYFRHRVLTADYAPLQVDQFAIAQYLLNWAQGITGGDIGIVVGSTTSGFVRDRNYLAVERHKVAQLIENLSAVEGGFDFAIDSAYDSNGNIVNTFTPSYPRRGTDTALVFEVGRNVHSFKLQVDATKQANSWHAIGAGEGETALRADFADSAQLDYTPLIEDTLSYTDVSVQETLDAHTQAHLTAYKDSVRIVQVRVAPDHQSAPFGAYRTGDRVRVRADDGPFLQYDSMCRIAQIEVSVTSDGQESVSLTFADTEPTSGA